MVKKRYLKLVSAVITTAMMLSLFAGCSKKEAEQPAAPAQTSVQAGTAAKSGVLFDKPTEFSILMQGRPEGPISNDLPIVKEMTKKTNVTFKWEQAPSDEKQYKEKFNILIASGDIPDIMVNSDKEVLSRGGVNGVFEPLNDYIEKYMPNLKKKFAEKPEVEKLIKEDNGKFYYFTRMTAVKTMNILIGRQDWLDKVGLKAPATSEEMYNVLKAFKEKDPNGNGKADEIPFTCRGKLSSLSPFFESFGVNGKEAFFVENGKVKYAYTDPRYKEGLAYLNKLYKEKLIDNEYATNDLNIWQSRLTTDAAGMTFDVFVRVEFLNNIIKKQAFTGFIPLKGPDGKAWTKDQQNPIGQGTSVSAKSKYKVEIAKFFNWMYSDEGILLTNFGVEGLTYNLVNGQPKYTDTVMKDPNKSALTKLSADFGHRDMWPYYTDLRYENEMGTESQNKIRDMIVPYIVPNYPSVLSYNDEERKVMTSKYTQILTYYEEMANKFVMGAESLDKFDDYAKKIDQMGIQDVLKVQQSAYDRFMKR